MRKMSPVSQAFLALGLGLFGHKAHAILDNGPSFTPDGKQVVFHSYREGAGELWLMNADGSGLKKLTEGDNHDRWPSVSADGKKVAFISRRDGNWDVYSVNIDGTDLTQVTKTPGNELGASFSPDGKQIAFGQMIKDEGLALVIANADGSHAKRLSKGASWPLWNAATNKIVYGKWGDDLGTYIYDPVSDKETLVVDSKKQPGSASWSPDGQWLYVNHTVGNNKYSMAKVQADGKGFISLDLPSRRDSRAAVSPGGKQVIWADERFGGVDLFSQTGSHGKTVNLTPNSHADQYPDINPSDGSMVITSKRNGNSDLFVLDKSGKAKPLTHSDANELGARWSEDGKHLVFSSDAGGTFNAYVMSANGHHVKQLTHNDKNSFASDWHPNGKRVAVTVGDWGSTHVSIVDTKDGKAKAIKEEGRAVIDADFTPDGHGVVYVSWTQKDARIVMEDLHSGKKHTIYEEEGLLLSPAVSPDGKRIAFVSGKDGDEEIYVMNIDGSYVKQVTDNYRGDTYPRWDKDSRTLVFDSTRYNNHDIFRIQVDGSKRIQVAVGDGGRHH